ncbi:uncharacterized protein G2W53_018194 [Senna tora]|uniref:Uncharacterized protein n=1 Tax=Senna tora TaxID=362788 RepID=A0A834WKV1_9FABA|nr:uncharacterized protein G2W53_018194 [Senna tora]
MKWDNVANCIVSEIRGQEVKIGQHDLAQLLGTKAIGYMFGNHQSTLSKIEGYDAQIVLKSLFAQPPEYVMHTKNFTASKFTFQNRLLHHIKNAIKPLTDEVKSPSAIDVNSLYNMCFTYEHDRWIEKPLTKAQKKILEQREREEAAEWEWEAAAALDSSSSHPPPHGPSNSEVLSAIQHLQRSVDEGFEQVNTRLNEFCTRIQALEVATMDNSQMIKDVERRFGSQD